MRMQGIPPRLKVLASLTTEYDKSKNFFNLIGWSFSFAQRMAMAIFGDLCCTAEARQTDINFKMQMCISGWSQEA